MKIARTLIGSLAVTVTALAAGPALATVEPGIAASNNGGSSGVAPLAVAAIAAVLLVVASAWRARTAH